MLPLNVTLSHYKRRDVQEEIILAARNREVAVRFNDKFGQRPDVLTKEADILELAKQRATSFHSSEELWKNPLQLKPEMKRHEAESLRIGWDLVLDVDCGVFEYSRIATELIIKALKFHSVSSVSCKFSGNKGFHIGVPFESFPSTIQGRRTSELFPDAPRRIAAYISYMIRKPLEKKIMGQEKDIALIAQKTGKTSQEITRFEADNTGNKIPLLNAEPFLVIDTILISPRHMFRMPYSLHEKSGLVSVPVDPEKVMNFEKQNAKPEKITISKHRFLDKEAAVKNDAGDLLIQAFDYEPIVEEKSVERKSFEIGSELSEEFFPPCIRLILDNRIKDGRKRAVFILLNFLTSVGWSYDAIESLLKEWNRKNEEPLREIFVLGQLRHHKQLRKKILPPNCDNQMYMVDIGVCKPDNLCAKIKNPVSYALRKTYFLEARTKNKNLTTDTKLQ
jgi:DNA primase catalytic subunit